MYHLNCALKAVWYALCVASCAWITKTAGSKQPDKLGLYYQEEGDINLGAILAISNATNKPGVCATKPVDLKVIQVAEALRFAARNINQDSTLLPGLKLGFVILDDCFSEGSTVFNAFRFAPRGRPCQGESQPPRYFAVDGVVGCHWSTGTALTSMALAPYFIPMISPFATSEDLNDKTRYPNLFRVVPPDTYQTRAMMKFIYSQGWEQISILYTRGTYGESAYKNLQSTANEMGVCIDAAISIPLARELRYCVNMVDTLLNEHSARVVVVFGRFVVSGCLLDAAVALGAERKLVWIGSDGWADIFWPEYRSRFVPPGIFVFSLSDIQIPGFQEYLKTIEANTTKNPWIHGMLAETPSCGDRPCNITEILLSVKPSLVLPLYYDAVYAYAHALNNLIRYKCSNATGARVKECLCQHKRELIDFIRFTDFHGVTGNIEFDQTGSVPSKYNLIQVVKNDAGELSSKSVAVYDIRSDMFFQISNDMWEAFDNVVPESACSEPCQPGEIKRVVSCCWVCIPCGKNEITTEYNTHCSPCLKFEIPDPATGLTTCKPLPRKFFLNISKSNPLVAGLTVLTAAGITLTKAILVAFLSNKSHTAIKASSLELSLLQMISVLTGYIAVVILLHTPSTTRCFCAFSLLSFSFNTLYAATLLKAIRLYRIFSRHRKASRLKFISARSQFVAMVAFTLAEVVLSTLFDRISGVQCSFRLCSSKTEDDYVEVYCWFPMLRITLFLTVHLVLLMLCSYFSFKTRKLPNRYNESSYVAFCLSTNIIAWLLVLPVISAPSHVHHRTLLLCYMVVLNHSIASICFFLTRLYQMYTLDEAKLRIKFAGPNGDGKSLSV